MRNISMRIMKKRKKNYYAKPAYEVYLAKQFNTWIVAAKEKALQMPGKMPPKQKFKGIFPPYCKVQPAVNPLPSQPIQPVIAQKPAAQPSAPSVATHRPPPHQKPKHQFNPQYNLYYILHPKQHQDNPH